MSSEVLFDDYFQTSTRILSDEDDLLIESNYHKWPLEKLLLELGGDKHGLTSVQAKYNRKKYGLNHLSPPINAPAWLCCLLPCIFSAPIMEQFTKAVPEHANVLRNGDWIKMDAESLVPGDIIQVSVGQRVPADMRVLQSENCTFNTLSVFEGPLLVADAYDATEKLLGSPNVGLLGYLVISGNVTGVVIATGSKTVLARLIRNRVWNPK